MNRFLQKKILKQVSRNSHFFRKPIFTNVMRSQTVEDLDKSFLQAENIEEKIQCVEFVFRNQPQFQEHVAENQGPNQTYDLVDLVFDNIKELQPEYVLSFCRTNFKQLNSMNLKELVVYVCEQMHKNDSQQLDHIVDLLESLNQLQIMNKEVLFLPNNINNDTLINYFQYNQNDLDVRQKIIFLHIFARNQQVQNIWKIKKGIISEVVSKQGLLDLGLYQNILLCLFLELTYSQVEQGSKLQEKEYFIFDCIKKLDQYPRNFLIQENFDQIKFQEMLGFYSQINYQSRGSIQKYFVYSFIYFNECENLIQNYFSVYINCLEQILQKGAEQCKILIDANFGLLQQYLTQEKLYKIQDFTIVQTLNVLMIYSRLEYIDLNDIRIKTLMNNFKEQVDNKNLSKNVNFYVNFFTSMYQLGINNLDAKSFVLQTFLQIKQDMPDFAQYADFYIAKLNNYN